MKQRGSLLPGADAFRVEELPAYAPCGEGEHLYVELECRNLTTDETARRLARALGVRTQAVGFAGRKDRNAVTRQWFSAHGGEGERIEALRAPEGAEIRVLQTARHRNKLRRGHLRGNRFSLHLELEPAARPALEAALAQMAESGHVNRFGPQRFGRAGANLKLARAWAKGELRSAVELALAPAGGWHLGEALPEPAGPFAGAMARSLARKPDDAAAALHAAGREFRLLIASSAQSAVFNAVLTGRAAAGLLHILREGDLARARGRPFPCLAERLTRLNQQAAPGALELGPTAPLPGSQCPPPKPEIEREERAWSDGCEIDWSWLETESAALCSRGERRRVVVPFLEAPRLREDEDGDATWLDFALPRGAFATELLRAADLALPPSS